jgi:hypothetical protein
MTMARTTTATRTVLAGLVAGLAGGVMLGILLTVVMPSTPPLPMVRLMVLLSNALGSGGLLAGWLAVLGVSALLGAVFGAALTRHAGDTSAISGAALLLGVGLWLIEALVGLFVFGAGLVLGLLPVLVILLVGNLLFASVLAAVFMAFSHRRVREQAADAAPLRRAA